jgi:RNA polymerase sigma factor (sigma-70 family)
MTKSRAKASGEAESQWSDSRTISECLRGNDKAWDALIEKYRKLIYSIPVRQGIYGDDAADVFQAVCLELLAELPRLRDPQALPAWLIRVAYRKCLQFGRSQVRTPAANLDDQVLPEAQDPQESPDEVIAKGQREQSLRDAVAALPPRCRQLVQMLFYENDPRPYNEIAASLGIATGSIGFIRGRCLERLRKHLEKAGFE